MRRNLYLVAILIIISIQAYSQGRGGNTVQGKFYDDKTKILKLWKMKAGKAYGFTEQNIKIELWNVIPNGSICEPIAVKNRVKINMNVPNKVGVYYNQRVSVNYSSTMENKKIHKNYTTTEGKNWFSYFRCLIRIDKVGDRIVGFIQSNKDYNPIWGTFNVPACKISSKKDDPQKIATGTLEGTPWFFKQGYVKRSYGFYEIIIGNKTSNIACKWYYIGKSITIAVSKLKPGVADISRIMVMEPDNSNFQSKGLENVRFEIIAIKDKTLTGKITIKDGKYSNLDGYFTVPICD